MTTQCLERLIYRDTEVGIYGNPLFKYLELHPNIMFDSNCSLCWRGYTGTWAIENGRLYLIKLSGTYSDKELNLQSIFPNQKKVFAEWHTGEIRIAEGKILESMGHSSINEYEIRIRFNKGIVVEEIFLHNILAPNQSPKNPVRMSLIKIIKNTFSF